METLVPFSQKTFLRGLLSESIVEILFVKRDGSERLLKGTLIPSYLPEQVQTKEDVNTIGNENLLSVWDTENDGWRSFRIDSIISTCVYDGD